MSDWRGRGKKQGDVVYFPYVTETTVKKAKNVFLWDVDKTYLDTKFESLKGIWRIATERPTSKANIPGTATLTRCLSEKHADAFAIFFVTASPPQIEHKIYQKLKHDGVEPYGIFCKDNLQNLRPQKLWRITKHVGYKLQALMQLRTLLAEDVKLVMFGDDGESDAVIYSLFSDICSRRIDSSALREVLNHHRVLDAQVDLLLDLQAACPNNDPVEKIYINLADDTDSDYYVKFGLRMVPTFNAFQTAVDLFQDQKLTEADVIRVSQRLVTGYGYTPEEIEKGYDDFIRRGRMTLQTYDLLTPELTKAGFVASDFSPTIPPREVFERAGTIVTKIEGWFDPWVPERIDYLHDYR